MKSAKSNNNNVKQKYEKVAQQDDTSEIVIFQSNRKVSVSFFLLTKNMLYYNLHVMINRVFLNYLNLKTFHECTKVHI